MAAPLTGTPAGATDRQGPLSLPPGKLLPLACTSVAAAHDVDRRRQLPLQQAPSLLPTTARCHRPCMRKCTHQCGSGACGQQRRGQAPNNSRLEDACRRHSVANHAGKRVDACKPGVERAAEQRSALPAGGPGALATDKQMPPLSSCDLLQLLGLPPGYMRSAARRSAPSMWRV